MHHFGLNNDVDLVMGTFFQVLGSMGGFVAGPKYVIDYLKHKARCLSLPLRLAPAVAGGVLSALQIFSKSRNGWKCFGRTHVKCTRV